MDECAKLGLRKTGRKEDLQQRLIQHKKAQLVHLDSHGQITIHLKKFFLEEDELFLDVTTGRNFVFKKNDPGYGSEKFSVIGTVKNCERLSEKENFFQIRAEDIVLCENIYHLEYVLPQMSNQNEDAIM